MSFSKISGLQLFERNPDYKSAYWLYGMHVQERERFIKAMASRDVPVSVVHLRIDHNSIFGGLRDNLPNQNLFNETQIHIPIHYGLTNEMVEYIIESIKKGW
jgi:perosamine synthetase